ncbi:MAG: hypothetical protein QOI02_1175 [Actinomycetota bacterium]|nr:hypothetical protein [Glaciihabitans sp.]MDQ1556173.1 hypothetical protein [Actinomycetota bacterium]
MKAMALTAVGAAVALVAGVVTAAPAQAVRESSAHPEAACSAGWYWRATGRGADTFGRVGSTHSDYNGTNSNASVEFTSSTSGTVGSTVSGSTEIALSVELASIRSQYGISVSVSKAVTIGNSIRITVPPHKTGNGDYGAWKAYVKGYEDFTNSRCTVTRSQAKKIYSPYKVGWKTWID